MKVEVVGHHGRPEDADGVVEGVPVRQGREEPARDPRKIRPGEEDLQQEAHPDGRHQHQDERLHLPDAGLVEEQDEEGVQRGDQHPVHQREAEEQLQPDRRPEHLGEVARTDRNLANLPDLAGQRLTEHLGEPRLQRRGALDRAALEWRPCRVPSPPLLELCQPRPRAPMRLGVGSDGQRRATEQGERRARTRLSLDLMPLAWIEVDQARRGERPLAGA